MWRINRHLQGQRSDALPPKTVDDLMRPPESLHRRPPTLDDQIDQMAHDASSREILRRRLYIQQGREAAIVLWVLAGAAVLVLLRLAFGWLF